ncbi:hypothetical protein [Xylella fastidiosa]|nr:hypothetical protein [Xylella fastidiosa]
MSSSIRLIPVFFRYFFSALLSPLLETLLPHQAAGRGVAQRLLRTPLRHEQLLADH